MRFEDVPALVTHVQPYRETSALVRFFTRDYGRMGTVMRGVRGKSKKAPANVQTFAHGHLSVVGRSDLSTVTRFDQRPALLLSGDALASGFYVLELVNRSLAEQQAEPAVYNLTLATLSALSEHAQSRPALGTVLRRYERGLLEALGFGVDFTHDAHNQCQVSEGRYYEYVAQQGIRPCQADAPAAIAGTTLLALGRHEYGTKATRVAAKTILREALIPLIGHQPLVSRDLLQPANFASMTESDAG